MSSSSSSTPMAGYSDPRLEQGEPGLRVGQPHLAVQAGPDALIGLNVVRGEVLVRRVPHLGAYLVVVQILLERLFVGGPVVEQPAGARVAETVAEDSVQPPRDLVDEVVHVAFKAAVVVAGEHGPAPVVEEGPPGEMDGLDAGEAAPVV